MKKALLTISTDWHIDKNNTNQIIELIEQQISLSKRLEVKNLVCLGDVFQSRQAQPLVALKCFEHILDRIHEEGLILIVIPGNHCKSNYNSYDSFLDQFKYHPGIVLINKYGKINLGDGFNYHFLPFFGDEEWIGQLNEATHPIGESDFLFSHIAFEGSVNNDGSTINSKLKPSIVGLFNKVFLGHYHNQHQIGDNIYHLPSIQANNFGEDNEKGFTVLYEDGSHELIKSEFKEYHTIKVNLDEVTTLEFDNLVKEASNIDCNVRFSITGPEDKIMSLKKVELEKTGVKIKIQSKQSIQAIEKAQTGEILRFNDSAILDEFDKFCDQEEYKDKKEGKDYLTKILKQNG